MASPCTNGNTTFPKHVVGPASPSLTFQAWFKAQFGIQKWDELDKIPRVQWGEYLQWYKTMTEPYVLNQYRLVDVQLNDNYRELILIPQKERSVIKRNM